MSGKQTAAVFFFAPFVSSTMRVEPQWIDYNGHMNMAYYHVLFDRTVDEAFEIAGLGPDYVQERGASFVVAEIHTLYRRELKVRDPVRITLQLLGHDEKRLHYYMEMRHADDGWVAAICESLSLHVDMTTKKVTPFPDDILANLSVMRASHARLAWPAMVGRVIGIPGQSMEAAAPALATGTRH